MNNDRSRLLRRLAAEDFAVYEATLYLDVYPDCAKALAYYRKHSEEAQRLRAEYTRRFGSLSSSENYDPTRWRWVEGPWPWEKEGN